MAELELRGYLTTGKFQVNDYTIEIENVSEGIQMKITDGDGNVQQGVIKDGEPGMTEAEVAQVKTLYNTLSEAFPEWQDNEEARAAAEKLRDEAENGPTDKEDPESDEDKAKYRAGLYQLMLALYNKYYPKVDEDLEAVTEAKTAAETAKTAAETAASQAQAIVLSDFATQIYYYDGDQLKFNDPDLDDEVVVTEGYSAECCFIGYVTGSRKIIHLKFPVAKSLDNISSVSCDSLKMNIANSGGYAATTGNVTGGTQYKDMVKQIVIDKVQNTLHVVIQRDDAFDLTNNACVNARVGKGTDTLPAVQFTLKGVVSPTNLKSVSGTVQWANVPEGVTLPDNVTVVLKSSASSVSVSTRTITADDNWEFTFSNLLKNDSEGTAITYTVEEIAVTGYTTTVSGYIIKNTYVG